MLPYAGKEVSMKIHASGEDYLEAVLVLKQEKGMVRSVDLARHMGFSKPSISHAVGVQPTDRHRPGGCRENI